jgi:hypothetical protein
LKPDLLGERLSPRFATALRTNDELHLRQRRQRPGGADPRGQHEKFLGPAFVAEQSDLVRLADATGTPRPLPETLRGDR